MFNFKIILSIFVLFLVNTNKSLSKIDQDEIDRLKAEFTSLKITYDYMVKVEDQYSREGKIRKSETIKKVLKALHKDIGALKDKAKINEELSNYIDNYLKSIS